MTTNGHGLNTTSLPPNPSPHHSPVSQPSWPIDGPSSPATSEQPSSPTEHKFSPVKRPSWGHGRQSPDLYPVERDLKAKLVPSPQKLLDGLQKAVGPDQCYIVEMRHNVYRIKASINFDLERLIRSFEVQSQDFNAAPARFHGGRALCI